MTVKIKVCGITDPADAIEACKHDIAAIGIVLSESPRKVSFSVGADVRRVLPPFVSLVGIFVNESAEYVHAAIEQCGLSTLQFQGDETPEYCHAFAHPCIKGFKVGSTRIEPKNVNRYQVASVLFDTAIAGFAGGTGRVFDWSLVPRDNISMPVVLAGGLNPTNVADAVARVHPYAVDVSTGVSLDLRRKDPELISAFVAAVQSVNIFPETRAQ